MRVIAGRYRGRRLLTPKKRSIRPTTDKIRGAIFNALVSRDALAGASVLDVFCGTGALGLEALSQGAAECTFIDKNRESLSLARSNAELLDVQEPVRFILKDACRLKDKPEDLQSATLAFLDPPYRQGLVLQALKALLAGGWLAAGAVCVVETEKDFHASLPSAFVMNTRKMFGDTCVSFAYYTP